MAVDAEVVDSRRTASMQISLLPLTGRALYCFSGPLWMSVQSNDRASQYTLGDSEL